MSTIGGVMEDFRTQLARARMQGEEPVEWAISQQMADVMETALEQGTNEAAGLACVEPHEGPPCRRLIYGLFVRIVERPMEMPELVTVRSSAKPTPPCHAQRNREVARRSGSVGGRHSVSAERNNNYENGSGIGIRGRIRS